MRYVALLRGINVGGKNIIKMADLKACFEALGFKDVETYIQSGNVIFSATGSSKALTLKIEKALTATFDYKALVVVCSRSQLQKIATAAPKGFGTSPSKYRYDVIFLKAPLAASVIIKDMPAKPGVDRVYAGSGVLYFSRLTAKATQSRLNKIIGMAFYQEMTIRNWNTTMALWERMET